MLILSLVIITGCTAQTSPVKESTENEATSEYITEVFGTDMIDIEILADEVTWQEMLNQAESESYIKVDVVINGTTFKDVGLRTKGNSSLKQVSETESDRYSFRLKFDEYVEGQTCFGLDTFVLNNIFGDHTYMKEYISYDILNFAGVDTPLFDYANISVNGETWGLYLAIEAYNDSYLERVYNDTSGELYNVKMEMGGEPNLDRPDRNTPQQNNSSKMMNQKDSGGSLKYTDDQSTSYASIFENGVGKTTEEDYQKVIQALKALSNGENISQYFDTEAIIKYLAAHTFVVNLDSYSSNMAQNYYLYESKGVLSVLPWDYNLSWGGFESSDSTSVINFPIDTPVSQVEMTDRPLISQLLSDSQLLEDYHEVLSTIVAEYFENGYFEQKVAEIDSLISNYVKNDPTAFCTYEQYKTAVSTFIQLGNLRAKSVAGQLDGTIPSTTEEQSKSKDTLISGENINLTDLGNMGKGQNGFQQNGERPEMPSGERPEMPNGETPPAKP